jgi:hypothetical protein
MQLGRGGPGAAAHTPLPKERHLSPCASRGAGCPRLRWLDGDAAPCGGQSPGLVRGLGHSCVHACAEDMSGRLSVWRAGTLTGSRTTDNTWCRVRQLMNPRGTHFSTSAAPTGRL